jgi:hypothetical protein
MQHVGQDKTVTAKASNDVDLYVCATHVVKLPLPATSGRPFMEPPPSLLLVASSELSSNSSTLELFELQIVDNNSCKNVDKFLLGSTSDGARVDAALSCGVTSSQPALSVWHAFIGDGRVITASTCTRTDFDWQMSVFAGGSCGQLTCFGNNADGCGRQSLVDLQSIQDQTCHMLVHGFGDASGNFALQISRLLCPQMFFLRMPTILPRQFDGCCAQKWELPT